jgi:hypothetical protein
MGWLNRSIASWMPDSSGPPIPPSAPPTMIESGLRAVTSVDSARPMI